MGQNTGYHDIDLDQYALDFSELQIYEENTVLDLEEVEQSDHWEPTDYEQYYLPHMRLAGIRDKGRVVLQNTADLHIHTHWSDGDALENVLARALTSELDAIAITDHDEIGGALAARRIIHEQRLPLAVIPGIEVSSRDGHIGALFVTRSIPRNLSAAETIARIHEAGGIAVAHHPFTPVWLDYLLGVRLSCRDLIKTLPFDAVECTNAVPGRGVRYNIAAIEAMRRNHINVAVTGGSDAHSAEFIGKGRTYYAGNDGIASLKKSLELGFNRGAESYWKTREKLLYYSRLALVVYRNRKKRSGSVN